MMMRAGRIGDLLNRKQKITWAQIQLLQHQMFDFYHQLPNDLKWSSENFKAHSMAKQSVRP